MSPPSQWFLILNEYFVVRTFTTKHNFAKGKLNRELCIGKKAVFGAPSSKPKEKKLPPIWTPLAEPFPSIYDLEKPQKLYKFSNERLK